MKKISTLLTLLTLFIVCNKTNAQNVFEKTFDFGSYDIAQDAIQTVDSGYLVTGGAWVFIPYTGFAMVLVKYNQNGDSIWAKQYPSMGFGIGYSVIQIPSVGFVVAGGYTDYNDACLIKTNLLGDTIWTRKAINQTFYGLSKTFDNNLIVCGQLSTGLTSLNDSANIQLSKYDMNGSVIWAKDFGGNLSAIAQSIVQTIDSGFILCGTIRHATNDSSDVFLMKTNQNGDSLWMKTFGGAGNDYGYFVKQTTDSGYVICGSTHNNSLVDSSDVWILKTNSNGDSLWSKSYGYSDNDEGRSVSQTNDGGYIVAGSTGTYPNQNVFLVKTDNMGNQSWTHQYGGANGDYGFSVRQTFDSGFLISGGTWSFGAPPGNGYLIKTDGNGISPVEELNNKLDFISIFPNPVHTSFTIHSTSQSQNAQIEIFNLLGEKIYSAPLNKEMLKVNCEQFSSAIYFLKITDGEKYYCKKIIIE